MTLRASRTRPAPRSNAVLIALCVVGGLIAYGSLYPFEFRAPASAGASWSSLLGAGAWWTSRGDVVGNVLLYVPFGTLFAYALPPPARVPQVVGAVALGVAFAFALQVLQIYLPARSAALADVFWNGVGHGLGLALGFALHGRIRSATATNEVALLPAALLLLWLATQVAPLVPTLDWAAIKHQLRGLGQADDLRWAQVAWVGARVAVVGALLHAAGWRRLMQFLGLLPILLIGKLFIVGQALRVETIVGYLLGALLWIAIRRWQDGRRSALLAAALLLGYSAFALVPLNWSSVSGGVHWLPFEAFLQGSMFVNSWALLESLFVFGSLLWLASQRGSSALGLSVVLAVWVATLEWLQQFLPGRTSDMTLPLLALAMGWVIQSADRRPALRHKPRPQAG